MPEFDVFKGLATHGFKFRGIDSNGGVWFEHSCGETHRMGPGATVAFMCEGFKDHLCETQAHSSAAVCDELCEQTIVERDAWEEFVTEVAVRLGCEREWSSQHDHRECIDAALTAMGR